MLKIVADENIPSLERYFAGIAQLVCYPGREIDSAVLADADVLLVRSVTRVDRSLLEGSSVKFVGSATIGLDHIDTAYLGEQNIAFAHAPGSNAQSVVEYVCSAICSLRKHMGGFLSKRVAVIGCGNVGSRLARLLKSLGCEVVGHDPFLASLADISLVSLEEALGADIISLHTPLTREGPHPTYHLLDGKRLALLKPGALLINSGRGAVIDNAALLRSLQTTGDLFVALDVWESEPNISLELMRIVDIATPHIAGYSLDGKLAGTRMLYEALCHCFALECPSVEVSVSVMSQDQSRRSVNVPGNNLPGSIDPEELFAGLIQQVYDVRLDDQRMRKALAIERTDKSTDEQAREFDLLRKNYPIRREWLNYSLNCPPGSAAENGVACLPPALSVLFNAE